MRVYLHYVIAADPSSPVVKEASAAFHEGRVLTLLGEISQLAHELSVIGNDVASLRGVTDAAGEIDMLAVRAAADIGRRTDWTGG